MKKILLSFIFLLTASTVLTACSSDDEGTTTIDPSGIKTNEVMILSKEKGIAEVAQTHDPYHSNPRCHKYYMRNPYHPDDPTQICILEFSCIIAESKVFEGLDLEIQSLSDQDFDDLKVGDTFDCTLKERFNNEAGLLAAISVVHPYNDIEVYATSGRVTVVDKKPVEGKPAITLKIEDLTYSSYTLSGTIQFER